MANAKKVAPEGYDKVQLIADHKTTSGAIRYLFGQGVSKGDIHRILEIRYQHVRNVLNQPLKKVEKTDE